MHKVLLTLLLVSLLSTASFSQSTKPIDLKDLSPTIKPSDNFFDYVNKKWMDSTAIPPSKLFWGSFAVIDEEKTKIVKTILQDAAKNSMVSRNNQLLGDFYTSGMDSAGIEKLGFTPIKKDLEEIAATKTLDDIINLIATERTKGIANPLFDFSIEIDNKETTQYVPFLRQGGLTLPDKDYYLKSDERTVAIRKAYLSYVIDMFKLIGDDSTTAINKANAILELETKLATHHFSKVELRDPHKIYNKFYEGDLSKTTPHLDWKILFAKMLITAKQDSLVVNNPGFFQFADSVLAVTPVSTLQTYLQWNIIKNAAPYLSADFVNRRFIFNKAVTGQKELSPRWQRTSNLVDGSLGDIIGQVYVTNYFKPEAKQRMIALVNNLQETFAERIQQLDWMSDATKQKALAKLEAMGKKIAYPDKWKTYDGVVINKFDLLGNVRRCSEWNYQYRAKKLGTKVDKTEWGTTPQTVNAFYAPSSNDIIFPAIILQPPFFNFTADDAVNYGAIGSVIGHEMTHGFDDEGRQFDLNGNLNDWWTEEDATKFKSYADKVADEYDAFTVMDSLHVNGKLTLGENIADLGGLNIAYAAFKKTPQGKSTQKIDGLTPDQRFFMGFAQVWRIKVVQQMMAQLIVIDPHSPSKYRVNGVVNNLDAFYKAFDVKPGDKMYKPEKERIKIW
ncbi:M13 family metallopeptidase [Ferruginibacter albus]|uniref:M13 family metallopeptidase n=1 Tax=Ferruginibacter albus TaxID=2875540 RepID=UPI001CC82D81|nr:M13 family metallopeptidase [Ferruginibacter albus]UAY51170.1 M13 family metallopeptidase [Ferruginibacter albus]